MTRSRMLTPRQVTVTRRLRTEDDPPKVRENRLRRQAERQGFAVVKSRRRDRDAPDFGRFIIVDASTKAIVASGSDGGFELNLEDVEDWLAHVITTMSGLMDEVARRLDQALSQGAPAVRARDNLDQIVLGLRMGLMARAAAVGHLADKREARAAMYDCLRTMTEAVAQLEWLTDMPEHATARAGCLELGQARADVHNRLSLLVVHKPPLVDGQTRERMESGLADAKRRLDTLRSKHPSPCRHCRGRGRDDGNAASWMHNRASRAGATRDNVNLYALYVGCSPDAHQLLPQRHYRADGNYVGLHDDEVGAPFAWAVDLLFRSMLIIAGVIRPETLDDVHAVRTWWHELMTGVQPSPR